MPGAEVVTYATGLRADLAARGAQDAELNELVGAGQALADALAAPSGTLDPATWDAVAGRWSTARAAIADQLPSVLLGPLAEASAIAGLVSDVGRVAVEGVHGAADLGPVRLEIASATLVIQPPLLAGNVTREPIVIGPFRIGEIGASLATPLGSGMPGGGAIVRLPGEEGFGGTLELPLGPVQIAAAAVLGMREGQASFLAIMGVTFVPPIQLSFGFSLDRVGGIVGVNRRSDTEALRAAVRSGVAGDVLFAVRPPTSPLALVTDADRLFPVRAGSHLVGPSLRLSWLSFGTAGSLISLDVAVIVEIPAGRVVILGVARASIPGLPIILNLRLDLLGIIYPSQQLASVDASLVDSHVLGVFQVYGDAAMRFSWGAVGYVVATVGGFFPGFNPEPARLPPLRRVGLAVDNPIPIIEIRVEGYFAITSNSLQLGGRFEIGISLGLEAHGFIQVDAIVQFRPFHFEARIAAGFDISAGGFSFASVGLSGSIAGPGPMVIRGSLSIDVFLFSISWDETFTIGTGPADVLPSPPRLLDVVAEELAKTANIRAQSLGDPQVVLVPRPLDHARVSVPPTGALQVAQRRVPLGLLVERVDGRPLGAAQGVQITTPGQDVTERFSPGSYIVLTDSEALSRPPFDVLPAGRTLSPPDPDPAAFPNIPDARLVKQIVISRKQRWDFAGLAFDLRHIAALGDAARRSPAISDGSPLVVATQEAWTTARGGEVFSSATAAHQHARYHSTVAVSATDAAAPVDLTGLV
jgi:hypothetical protein